ncbi:hypothetical protein [Blastococcus mobilis]|uniref:Uncharacterized protein n=1 Tax=Blastococcus mobilis TaxID=1938746 RepID=A0A238WQV7_9ACTN|nr:hypothetical protein [Blastococcus mobilis]SNR48915.1 hypothetical protein SAMN06272737_10976 [Blastococcus mobilis]
MTTQVIARGAVGSLRLVGVTAVVAAGIAGFATVDAGATPTEVVVVSATGHLPQLPPHVCDKAKDHVPGAARPFLSCRVIGDDGPIEGGSIFS